MAQLKLLDPHKAGIYGLPAEDTTAEALQKLLTAGEWTNADALKHIDAALSAGVYQKVESKRTGKADADGGAKPEDK